MGTKSKVSSIKEKLHKLEKQLETIQKDCPHTKLSLKFVNPKLGVRWVCDECQISARIPTPKEIEEWIQK